MAAVRAQPVQSFATWGQIYYCVSKCLSVTQMQVHNKLYRKLNRQLKSSEYLFFIPMLDRASNQTQYSMVKFTFSKKATKIDKIFTVDLTLT